MQSPDSMQELMSCDDAAISGQTYKFHIGTQVQGGDLRHYHCSSWNPTDAV